MSAELEQEIRRNPTMNEQFLLGLLDEARGKISAAGALIGKRPNEKYDDIGNFLGFVGGGEHRTVSPHRAWSYDDSEWCYPSSPCDSCEIPVEPVDLRAALAGYVEQES